MWSAINTTLYSSVSPVTTFWRVSLKHRVLLRSGYLVLFSLSGIMVLSSSYIKYEWIILLKTFKSFVFLLLDRWPLQTCRSFVTLSLIALCYWHARTSLSRSSLYLSLWLFDAPEWRKRRWGDFFIGGSLHQWNEWNYLWLGPWSGEATEFAAFMLDDQIDLSTKIFIQIVGL